MPQMSPMSWVILIFITVCIIFNMIYFFALSYPPMGLELKEKPNQKHDNDN